MLRQALGELQGAGYELRDNALVNKATGAPLAFEILVTTREDERLALAYQSTLERIGIRSTVRTVDAAQYQQRKQSFDYDMIRFTWAASLSPGNEQIEPLERRRRPTATARSTIPARNSRRSTR